MTETEVEVPHAAVEAVLAHRWGAGTLPPDAHAEHNYYGGCAVCRGDVPAILAIAAPHIAAAALRQAAEDLPQRRYGAVAAWLRYRANELVPPAPDTREGILAAAGLTEADMQERADG